jgi:O-antigen ligase
MDVNKKNISKLFYLFVPLVLGIIILIYSLRGLSESDVPGNIVFPKLTALSYLSLTLFVIVSFLGLYSSHLYFTFLIFILLAFPAPINDFFPGTYLGNPTEFGAAIFPFFTHVDIYLFFGILKAILSNNKISFRRSILFFFVIICLFISIFVNFFHFDSSHELLLLVSGLFQFRYLIELFLLCSFYDLRIFKNNILISFMFSVIFLFMEASVFTYKNHSSVLSSGSLANNTYASVVASILLFFIFLKKKYPHSFIFKSSLNASIVVSIITVVWTGARMAVLAFFVSYFIISFIEYKKGSLTRRVYWVITLVAFIIGAVVAANHLPKRYNLHNLTDKITINKFSWDLKKFINIERSWETNSLISRLELYTTSIKMFSENKVAGIGVGRWNIKKKKYGFREHLLIDSHNGYLSVISQYGILGIPLMFFIYLFPIVKIFRYKSEEVHSNFLFYLAVINLFMSIADLSNSGIFKHQIFGLLAFNSICLLQINESEESYKAQNELTAAG